MLDVIRQALFGNSLKEFLPGPAPPEPPDLLTILDEMQRVLIVGPSNTGKTTLLHHITSRRRDSSVVVIDPHASPTKWPGCQVIGQGRDFMAIELALHRLLDLMTERYLEISSGAVVEAGHPKITIIIDEWWAIRQEVRGAGKIIAKLLVEGRKASFSIFVGTHSEQVKALGLEGEGDLRDGFTIVKLYKIRSRWGAVLVYGGDEKVDVDLPGPFVRDALPSRPVKNVLTLDSPYG